MTQDSQHELMDIFKNRKRLANNFHYGMVCNSTNEDIFIQCLMPEYGMILTCLIEHDSCPKVIKLSSGILLRCLCPCGHGTTIR